jgi:transposase
VKKAATLMGIGAIGASAAVATVGDFRQFGHAAQFGAWIGLTLRRHSSGGKTRLGGITKRGDNYLRSLLIQGAKSAVMARGEAFNPRHVSIKPGASTSTSTLTLTPTAA